MQTDKFLKISSMKGKEKIAAITCYSYELAHVLSSIEGIDLILVGDSLAEVHFGRNDIRDLTMDEMCSHIGAVRNGAQNKLIVADMPFGSYSANESALENAVRLLEAGADAVKPEGRADIVAYLAENSVQVLGHIGYKPQSGAYLHLQGKTAESFNTVYHEAIGIENAGAFAIVIELATKKLARAVTSALRIPTIGIYSGETSGTCNGRIIVCNDALNLSSRLPKGAIVYFNAYSAFYDAFTKYAEDAKGAI